MSVSTQSQKLPSKEGSIFKKIVVRLSVEYPVESQCTYMCYFNFNPFAAMLWSEAIQEWVKICTTDPFESKIQWTWRYDRLLPIIQVLVLEFSTSTCRNTGYEGVNNELPGAEGGGVRPGEEGVNKWPQKPRLLARVWSPSAIGQEVWWSHQVLSQCLEVGQRQCSDSQGSLSATDTNERPWRI